MKYHIWTEGCQLNVQLTRHPSFLMGNQSHQPDSPKSLMWEGICEVQRKYDELHK